VGSRTAPDDAYRSLFDHAPAHGMALLDAEGRIVDWNLEASRLTGVAVDDALQRDHAWLMSLVGDDDDDDDGDALEAARAGDLISARRWVTSTVGGRRWCHTHFFAIPGPGGGPGGFAAVIQDATQALRSEVSHPESEDRFVRALEHAPVFVFQQDRDLRYVWAPAAIPALGIVAPEMAIGRGDEDLLPPEAAAALSTVKHSVMSGGEGRREEVSLRTPAGDFVVDLIVEPVHGPDGALAGLTGVVIDVTERRRMEDDLRHSRRLLAEAEHLARLGSWEWDIATDTIEWSDGLYEIYGLTPETFDARFAARNERVHPEDRERVGAAVAEAMRTGAEIAIDYRILRPDGRVRRVHGRAEVIVDEQGRPVRMAGTAQDVTEVRAAEEALQRTPPSSATARRSCRASRGAGPASATIRRGCSARASSRSSRSSPTAWATPRSPTACSSQRPR
jgi:PAS domain S-box-containing protein